MKSTYGKIFLTFLVIGICALFKIEAASAQLSISIYPLSFTANVNPGDTWRGSVTVINPNDYAIAVSPEKENFVGGAEGDILLTEHDQEFGLSSWIKYESIKELILAPGERRKVNFEVIVPQNAQPGDEDFDGVVIKIAISQIEVMDEVIEAWAGTPLSLVLNTAVKNGLAGLEWAAGIPGTLGGAIRGNAGAMGQSMKDCIQKVFVWSDGEIREFSNEECGFDYRESVFKRESEKVIIKAVLNLKKGEKQDILQQISQNLLSRKKYSTLPSAGSFFKNIPLQNWPDSKDKLPELFIERKMVPAGWLIENCGLKGFKIGDAGVSQEHGNFLVNLGNATYYQFLQLVEEIQKKVYDKYGVGLEPEVQIGFLK